MPYILSVVGTWHSDVTFILAKGTTKIIEIPFSQLLITSDMWKRLLGACIIGSEYGSVKYTIKSGCNHIKVHDSKVTFVIRSNNESFKYSLRAIDRIDVFTIVTKI